MKSIHDIAPLEQSDEAPFAFGKNWQRFLSRINQERIEAAEESLQNLLGSIDFHSSDFLDAGSGSGLFSLAANRLGAKVTSFDVDPDSVACTETLKDRFGSEVTPWHLTSGSLVDQGFLRTLGTFDIVYCWGVAHHTGSLWEAIDNLSTLVNEGGLLVLAVYNDQLYISRAWREVKRIYQRLPRILRPLFVVGIGLFPFFNRLAVTTVACLLRAVTLQNPFVPILNWVRQAQVRGMHSWYDLVDWVGGWPFEVAKPEAVFRFLRDPGFTLQELTTSGGHGCNEFVFKKISSVSVEDDC